MKRIKFVLFEYYILSCILLMIFIQKYCFNRDIGNYIFIISVFIIYSRYYHLDYKIVIESNSKTFMSK